MKIDKYVSVFNIGLQNKFVYRWNYFLRALFALIFLYFRHYIALPDQAMTYVFASISMVMAALMQFFITYSLAMMAFWILEISTIVFIVYSFEYFLGGQMFPIDIMPNAVQAVMKWLPFYYELFCPVAIFLGRLRGAALAEALAIQTGWLLLTWAAARAMWKRGLGHYQAVGG